MIKAVIIDDETRARRILKTLLEEYCPEVEVIAEAEDVPSGVKTIHKHQPDVIFLDIEMPGYTGFQLLDFFDKVEFEIIFTTAYREYALQAFQVSAVDYLLKPIQIDELIKSVEKLKKHLINADMQERLDTLKSNYNSEGVINKMALPVSDGLLFTEVKDIIYLAADGSYTDIFFVNGKNLLVSKKLKEFDKLLQQGCFFKTHRSFIINLHQVKQYVKQEGGYIVMSNDNTVNIARDKKDTFLEAMQRL